MSKLFIMAGTKGGIGKSLAASLLADVALDCKYRPVLFDCDDENRSLSNFYDEQNPDYTHKSSLLLPAAGDNSCVKDEIQAFYQVFRA